MQQQVESLDHVPSEVAAVMVLEADEDAIPMPFSSACSGTVLGEDLPLLYMLEGASQWPDGPTNGLGISWPGAVSV